MEKDKKVLLLPGKYRVTELRITKDMDTVLKLVNEDGKKLSMPYESILSSWSTFGNKLRNHYDSYNFPREFDVMVVNSDMIINTIPQGSRISVFDIDEGNFVLKCKMNGSPTDINLNTFLHARVGNDWVYILVDRDEDFEVPEVFEVEGFDDNGNWIIKDWRV